MTTLEVRAVEHLLGSGIPYAYAVKAGPWIFLTGHEAFDFKTGVTEAVAGARFHPRADAPDPAGTRVRSRAWRAPRPVLPDPGRGRPLSPGPPRRVRRLHSAEHLGRHGKLLWCRER